MVAIVTNPYELVNYLQERHVLKSSQICSCNKQMNLVKRTNLEDGLIFQCPNKCSNCSIRKGSIFFTSKLPLKKLVMLAYLWILDISSKNIKIMLGTK